MYPLQADRLSLTDLADHLARDMPQRPRSEEVLDVLVQAFWSGDLQAHLGSDASTGQDPRLRLLDVCCIGAPLADGHPGLLFFSDGASLPPDEVLWPDGGVSVDLRRRVLWKPSIHARDSAIFDAACGALAKAKFDDFNDPLKIGLAEVHVLREDFAAFCKARRSPLPGFWFGKSATTSTARAEAECRRWLREQVKVGPKWMPKQKYFEAAAKIIDRLTPAAFKRAWNDDKVVPESWKRRGTISNAARKSRGNTN